MIGNLNEGDYFEDLGTVRDNNGTDFKTYITNTTAFEMLIISLQVTSTYRINSRGFHQILLHAESDSVL
jgi:hypothetical protein